MFEIISHYLIFLTITFSNGFILKKILIKKNSDFDLNFFEISIFGLIVTGFIATILNFFLPLNDIIIYINLSFCIFLISKYYKEINFRYDKNSKSIIILFLILSLINIYGSGFSDDLHHYHGGYISNTDNQKYIIGLNYLHHHYGYSSIWLILHSYLNFNNSLLQDIHIVNGIIFFLILSYFITEILNNSDFKKNYTLYILSSIFIYFFLVKYTRLKEFGLDRPGILIFCFLIYFAAKYEKLLKLKPLEIKKYFFLIFLVCIFITSIKIFFISSFLLPIILVYKSKNYSLIYTRYALIVYILGIIYLLKNFLISGCLIYPFDFTCISGVPWNSKEIASKLILLTEASTKAYSNYNGLIAISEYIKNFNWWNTWISRTFEELINFSFTIFFIFLLFLFTSKFNNTKKNYTYFQISIILVFLLNMIIFFKSPVIRYHHMSFLLLIISIIILMKKEFLIKKNVFSIILILAFLFNFGKNLIRINENNYYNNPYKHVKKINWYESPKEKKLQNFSYYIGWIDASPVGNMILDKYKHKKKIGFDIIYK